MKPFALPSLSVSPAPVALAQRLPLRIALWLLDRPHLGQARRIKQFAGRLLKQPARQGVVMAQSRLGQLLCCECGNARDRRIGLELLRQASKAGSRPAQLALGQLCNQSWVDEPQQARHWLELAAGQGCDQARQLLESPVQA
ncbi:MAG: sel1 repeat family protein [Pseudomonadota bacterium]